MKVDLSPVLNHLKSQSSKTVAQLATHLYVPRDTLKTWLSPSNKTLVDLDVIRDWIPQDHQNFSVSFARRPGMPICCWLAIRCDWASMSCSDIRVMSGVLPHLYSNLDSGTGLASRRLSSWIRACPGNLFDELAPWDSYKAFASTARAVVDPLVEVRSVDFNQVDPEAKNRYALPEDDIVSFLSARDEEEGPPW